MIAIAAPLGAQPSVARELAAGDGERDARQPVAALAHYEAALALAPNNYGALYRTSSVLIDLAEFNTNRDERKASFVRASALARQATTIAPDSAAGYFELSRALGREALTVGARERIAYAVEIRETALRTLAIDSLHAGAMHVLGRWNAEIMGLNGLTRLIAKRFLGGKVLGEASWDNAVRWLERAVQIQPNRTVHLLALGEIYRDTGQREKARRTLEAAIRAPLRDANDPQYKEAAQADLDALP